MKLEDCGGDKEKEAAATTAKNDKQKAELEKIEGGVRVSNHKYTFMRKPDKLKIRPS